MMGGQEGRSRGLFRKENAIYWVFVAMFAVSTAAILIKLSDSHPLTIAFWRLLLSEFVLLPFFLYRFKEDMKELSLGTILGLVLVGLSLALHFGMWIWSFEYTGVASSVLLVTVHPIFVASISAALFKERLRWLAVVGIAVAFIGSFVIVIGDLLEEGFSLEGKHLLGNLLALGGALMAGIYLLSGSRFRKRLSLPTYAFIVYGSAACFLFLAIPFAKAQVLVEDFFQTRNYDLKMWINLLDNLRHLALPPMVECRANHHLGYCGSRGSRFLFDLSVAIANELGIFQRLADSVDLVVHAGHLVGGEISQGAHILHKHLLYTFELQFLRSSPLDDIIELCGRPLGPVRLLTLG